MDNSCLFAETLALELLARDVFHYVLEAIMAGPGKQAKTLRKAELNRLLHHVSASRHPERDRAMVLLSFKAGLRAKEIAGLTWSMVTDTSGELADAISLPNSASKG
jgi:integrase